MTDDPRPSTTGANADTTGSRWAELKDLFDSAISLQGPDREFYISQKCGPNEELRRELQSLLVAYEETGDFLERPFASIKAFSELEPAAPDPAGQRHDRGTLPSGPETRAPASSVHVGQCRPGRGLPALQRPWIGQL